MRLPLIWSSLIGLPWQLGCFPWYIGFLQLILFPVLLHFGLFRVAVVVGGLISFHVPVPARLIIVEAGGRLLNLPLQILLHVAFTLPGPFVVHILATIPVGGGFLVGPGVETGLGRINVVIINFV